MPPKKDIRPAPGSSATFSNVAPERAGVDDPDDFDSVEGTTSGARLRGKPRRGSIESGDF